MMVMWERFDRWYVKLDWLEQIYVLSLPLAAMAVFFLVVLWRLERVHSRTVCKVRIVEKKT